MFAHVDGNGKPLPGDYVSENRPISTADEFQDSLHGYPIYWYYNDTSMSTTYTTVTGTPHRINTTIKNLNADIDCPSVHRKLVIWSPGSGSALMDSPCGACLLVASDSSARRLRCLLRRLRCAAERGHDLGRDFDHASECGCESILTAARPTTDRPPILVHQDDSSTEPMFASRSRRCRLW